MTRDDVIRMAQEAGGGLESDYTNISALQRFTDAIIESVAQHLETSGDRYRRDYFAAKVRELKTQAPAQPVGQDRIDAERYRWLKARPVQCPTNGPDLAIWEDDCGEALRGDDADAAIDAAMKGETK